MACRPPGARTTLLCLMRSRFRSRSRQVAGSTGRVVRRIAFVVLLVVAIVPTVAAASPPRAAQLTYSRGTGAADCPDADVIRAGVAARLGYEPFCDHAQGLVAAAVNRTGRTLEARIQIGGAGGAVSAERKLVSRESDCVELASAIELAISIAIDPLAGSRPRPAPPPAPPPAPAAAPAPPSVIVVREPAPPPPTVAPPSAPIGFQVRLCGLGTHWP